MNTPPKNQNSQIVFSPDTYTGLAKIAAKKKVSVSELVAVICNNYIWSNWTDPEHKDSEIKVLNSRINILDQQRKNNLTAQELVNSTIRDTLGEHQQVIDNMKGTIEEYGREISKLQLTLAAIPPQCTSLQKTALFDDFLKLLTKETKLSIEPLHPFYFWQYDGWSGSECDTPELALLDWIKSAIDDINSLSEELDSSSLPSPLTEAIGRQGLQITCHSDGYRWVYKGIESEEYPSQQQALASWVKYITQRHEELLIENRPDDSNLFDLLGVQVAEADDDDDGNEWIGSTDWRHD